MKKEIILQFKHDLYSLALCCNLLIDKKHKKLYRSLKGERLSFEERELIMKESSLGESDIALRLFQNAISAVGAACFYNKMWEVMSNGEIDDYSDS